MKVLFMGTPDFAVASLRALWGAGYEIVGVFCQPDKPRSHMKVTACPVKEFAQGKEKRDETMYGTYL